jgi:hypothetical protein
MSCWPVLPRSRLRRRRDAHGCDVSAFFPEAATAVAAGPVARIAGVESSAADSGLSVRPAGTDYFPDYNLYSRAPLAAGSEANTPVITAGRPDENGRQASLDNGALLGSDDCDPGIPLRHLTCTFARSDQPRSTCRAIS